MAPVRRSGRRGALACLLAAFSVVGLLSPAYAVDPPTITTSFPKVADVGASVTVRGTGFSTTAAQNTVTVNGVPVTLTQSRVDQLKFTVPAGLTSGPLQVTTGSGTAVWVEDIYVPPTPLTAAQVSTARRAVPSAPSVVARVTDPGQVALTSVPTQAGERIALQLTGSTFGAATDAATITVHGPDGAVVSGPTDFGSAGLWIDPLQASVGGTYTVVVDPAGDVIGKVDVAAHVVPADTEVAATTNGTPVTAAVSAAGQNAAVTFTGTADEYVSLTMSNNTFAGSFNNVQVKLLNPAGQEVISTRGLRPEMFLGPRKLYATGTYRLVIDPSTTRTGQVDVQVHTVPTDTTVAGALDTTTALQPTTVPGQNATLTFAAATGQKVAVDVSDVALTADGTGMVSLIGPDGATVSDAALPGPDGALLDPVVLPADGIYTVVLDPTAAATGGATVHPYVVPADGVVDIAGNGLEHQIEVNAPGSRTQVRIAAAAGSRVALGVSQATLPAGTAVTVTGSGDPSEYVLPTDGALFVEPVTVPESGIVSVLVDPVGRATGSLMLRAFRVNDDLLDEIAVGASETWEVATPGQTLTVDVVGGTGQLGERVQLSVAWTAPSHPGLPVTATVLAPDGQAATDVEVRSGEPPAVLDLTRAQAGTYRVAFDPDRDAVGTLDLRAWVAGAANAAASIDGAPVTVTSGPGEQATITFTVPTGSTPRVGVLLYGSTYNSDSATVFTKASADNAARTADLAAAEPIDPLVDAVVTVHGPDGSVVVPAERVATNTFLEPFVAEQSGDYVVRITPPDDRGGSASAAINTVPDDPTPTLVLGGAPARVLTSMSGQNIAATTTALPAGEIIKLAMHRGLLQTRVTVTDPSGTVLVDQALFGTRTPLQFTTTTTGTYSVFIDPQGPGGTVLFPWVIELYQGVGLPIFGYGPADWGSGWTTSAWASWSVFEPGAQWAVLVDDQPTSDPGTTITTPTPGFYADLPDGEHWLHVRAILNDGSYGPAGHLPLRVDTTAPAVLNLTSTSHPDPDTPVNDDTATFSWSGVDAHAGVTGYSTTTSPVGDLVMPDETVDTTTAGFTTDALADGTYNFTVQAVDDAYNWSEPVSFTFTVDADAPTAPTVTTNTHPTPVGSSAATLVATWAPGDDDDDIEGWRTTLDQQPSTDPTGPATSADVLRDSVTVGTWWLHVQGQDRTGRWSPTTHYEVAVTSSAAAISAPVTGQVLWTDDPITFTCSPGAAHTISLNGPTTATLGPVTGDANGTCTSSWDVDAAAPDGSHVYPNGEYQLHILDAGGQVVSDTLTVAVHADADPGEGLEYDVAVGLLTQEQATQIAADSMFNPSAVPARYAATAVVDDLSDPHHTGHTLVENWDLVDAQTRQQVETVMADAVALHPASGAAARRSTSLSSSAAAGPCTMNPTSKVLFGSLLDSYSVSDHMVVLYDKDLTGPLDPVTGCPQFIVDQLDAFETAYAEYDSVSWELPEIVPVVYHQEVPSDMVGDRALTLPFGIQFWVEHDSGSRYLPQHELMHTAQFELYTTSDYRRLGSDLWWWNEAAANWGQFVANRKDTKDKYPAVGTYAYELNDFLANTDGRFDDVDVVRDWPKTRQFLAGGQEYGAFVLPLYLNEQFGRDVVLDITKQSAQGAGAVAPALAMNDELKRRGEDPAKVVERFRWATYTLEQLPNGGLGFDTIDVDAFWRGQLIDEDDPRLPDARTPFTTANFTTSTASHAGTERVAPSGSRFIELNRPDGVDGTVEIVVDLDISMVASVARGTIANSEVDLCSATRPFDHLEPARRITGASTTVELTDDCPTAILHLHSTARTYESGVGTATWEAKFLAGGASLSNGTIEIGINQYGGLITDDLGLRRGAYEVLNKRVLSEGWGIGNSTGLAGGYTREEGRSGDLRVAAFTVNGNEAATAVTDLRPSDGIGLLRVTHEVHPSSHNDLFQIDVTVENRGLSPVSGLHYRRVFDWDIDINDYTSYVTWAKQAGADDSFVHGTSNDGFADPNPSTPLGTLGRTGYFTDAGPDDHGGLIDVTVGSLAAGDSRTFTIYYGLSTSETNALDALAAVGAEVYNLGQADAANGPTLGTPVTAMFGIDGTGLRGSPGSRLSGAGDEPVPDGQQPKEPYWSRSAADVGGDG